MSDIALGGKQGEQPENESFLIGFRHLRDAVEEPDFKIAEDYLLRAALAGHTTALCILGVQCQTRKNDPVAACNWYSLATELGSESGWKNLSRFITDRGRGVFERGGKPALLVITRTMVGVEFPMLVDEQLNHLLIIGCRLKRWPRKVYHVTVRNRNGAADVLSLPASAAPFYSRPSLRNYFDRVIADAPLLMRMEVQDCVFTKCSFISDFKPQFSKP